MTPVKARGEAVDVGQVKGVACLQLLQHKISSSFHQDNRHHQVVPLKVESVRVADLYPTSSEAYMTVADPTRGAGTIRNIPENGSVIQSRPLAQAFKL